MCVHVIRGLRRRGRILIFTLLLAHAARAQSGYVDVDGGRVYYEAAGAGHPLVLIHGGGMDSRMWDAQFALFAKSYRVIRYDVRGFGKSPPSTAVYADDDDLVRLLQHLGITKTYVVGLSLGGRIAIDLMLSHPDLVDAGVLAAPGLSGFRLSEDPDDAASLRAAQAGDWEAVTHYWLISSYMSPAMQNPALAPRLHQLALDNAHEVLDNLSLERILDPPAIDRLRQVKAPTLIIVGARDVASIHEICGLLFARVPGAKEIVIPNTGHIVNMEQPERFNRAVLDFLAALSH